MTFGEVIFELRQQRKLTQIQFAEELMIDVKTLRRWEKGQTVPGFREIQRIAGILVVPEDFLLTSAKQTAHESKNNEISIRQAKSQEPDTSLSLNEVKNQILTSLDEKAQNYEYILFLILNYVAFKTTPFGIIPAGIGLYLSVKHKYFLVLKIIAIIVCILSLLAAYGMLFGLPDWMVIVRID